MSADLLELAVMPHLPPPPPARKDPAPMATGANVVVDVTADTTKAKAALNDLHTGVIAIQAAALGKPGRKTSEAWLVGLSALASFALAALAVLGIHIHDGAVEPYVALAAVLASSAGVIYYAASRHRLKLETLITVGQALASGIVEFAGEIETDDAAAPPPNPGVPERAGAKRPAPRPPSRPSPTRATGRRGG